VRRRPLIGVSTGFTDYGDYLGFALSRPLLAAGALPLLLPYVELAAERRWLLDHLDGLLLGFGRDLDPSWYGAAPHPSMTATARHRDEIELDLAREALHRGLPLLGICRGLQVLNVALGGTLYRDRSEYPEPARDHPGGDWDRWERVCQATLGHGPMPEHPQHPVSMVPGSVLAKTLGGQAVTNSYHHQAVRDLGAGVEVAAWSDDGIIEAVEVPSAPGFALAVQWELQESWQADERFLEVFRAFVSTADEQAPATRGWRRRSR
jgi:putative glutamine amidotransferase